VIARISPATRLNEGMAWTHAGLAAGVAAGAAVAGQVVDAAGGRVGFVVPLAAGVVTAALTLVVRLPASSRDVTEDARLARSAA